MDIWFILLLGVLLFFGILVLLLVFYDRGYVKKWPLQWTGMGYTQLAKETQEAHAKDPNQTITYNVQPRKTLWDLFQLFLVPLVLALVVVAFNVGQASTSQQLADQSQQKQTQLADQSQQEQVVNTYIDQMSNLLLQHNLHDSKLGDPIRAVAQALTLAALSRLDSAHKNIIILFLYRADVLKYHYYKNKETECGDPNVLKKRFSDELPIITLSQGNIAGVAINNLSLACIDLHNMHLEGSNFATSDLDRADLGLSFAMNADFSYASMNSANLYFLDLENAHLQRTKLQSANMEGICLAHARLDGADLQYADLRVYYHFISQTVLYCDKYLMSSGILNNSPTAIPANLSGAVLTNADLRGAYLSGANLRGANLIQANLTGADLSGASLSGARLDKKLLKGARYNTKEILVKDSQGNNLIDELPTVWPLGLKPKAEGAIENNTLSGANLSGANLSEASLYNANLSGANLSGTNLNGANLSGANLSGANLSGASLNGAILSGANLSGANLNEASLYEATLSEANLSKASFNDAFLWGANLSGANLRNSNITHAQLHVAEFLKSTIMPNGSKHP